MYPILYDTNKIYFNLGKGKLVDCLSCIVSEEINGDYSLEFTYPVTGPFFDELLQGGSVSVVCPHVRRQSNKWLIERAAEWFDLYKHSIPINGVVTFYAQHASRRLSKIVFPGGNIGGSTLPSSLEALGKPAFFTSPYDGLYLRLSQIGAPASSAVEVGVQSCLSVLLGSDSFVSHFGGEFIWSSGSIYSQPPATAPLTVRGYWVAQRGEDRGVEIRHGYNLTDINATTDTIDAYNAVVPYWDDGNGNKTFVTGYIVQPTTPITPIKAVSLDATDAFENQPTEAQLITFAQNHLDNNTPWNGAKTLDVDFVNGAEIDPHGADIALGDTVHVYWKDGRVDTQLRVVSYKYDVLAERYSELRLGTPQTQFVAITGESYTGGSGGGGGGGLPPGGQQGDTLIKNSNADGDVTWAGWTYVGGASGSTVTPFPNTNWTECYIEAYFPLNQNITFAWTRPRIAIPLSGSGIGTALSGGYMSSTSDYHACLVYCTTDGVWMYGYWRNGTSYTASYKVWVR